MNFLSNISVTEIGPLLNLVQESAMIKRHYDLFNWLQNQVQQFIPHDILIVAWGDFSLGLVRYDIVSPLPGMRTDALSENALQPFLAALYQRWAECSHTPFTMRTAEGLHHEQVSDPALAQTLSKMRCGLIHGIKDQRGYHDCLYIFLGPTELGEPRTRDVLRFLLPHIDTACRQICLLPEQHYYSAPEEPKSGEPFQTQDTTGLSQREAEIMHWVGLGKTNLEIGKILDISPFTVKNHLQRIFKKLNVSNRAQAVARL